MTKITADNISTATDEQISAQIACYARMWNPFDSLCVGCVAQARCLERLALHTLPQEALERTAYEAAHQTGHLEPKPERLDLNELASEYQTDARALQYALQFWKNRTIGLPVIQNGVLVTGLAEPQVAADPAPIQELETLPPVDLVASPPVQKKRGRPKKTKEPEPDLVMTDPEPVRAPAPIRKGPKPKGLSVTAEAIQALAPVPATPPPASSEGLGAPWWSTIESGHLLCKMSGSKLHTVRRKADGQWQHKGLLYSRLEDFSVETSAGPVRGDLFFKPE